MFKFPGDLSISSHFLYHLFPSLSTYCNSHICSALPLSFPYGEWMRMNGFTWWMIMIWELLDCDCSQRENENILLLYRRLSYSYLLCSSASEGECLSGKKTFVVADMNCTFSEKEYKPNHSSIYPFHCIFILSQWLSVCCVVWLHINTFKNECRNTSLYHGLLSFSNFHAFIKHAIPLFPTNFPENRIPLMGVNNYSSLIDTLC